jgi:hypothetical protein
MAVAMFPCLGLAFSRLDFVPTVDPPARRADFRVAPRAIATGPDDGRIIIGAGWDQL